MALSNVLETESFRLFEGFTLLTTTTSALKMGTSAVNDIAALTTALPHNDRTSVTINDIFGSFDDFELTDFSV